MSVAMITGSEASTAITASRQRPDSCRNVS